MLPRPSFIKIPDASMPNSDQAYACSDGYKKSDGSWCNNGFECNPYQDTGCQDSTYCGWSLGVGVVAVIGGVVIS